MLLLFRIGEACRVSLVISNNPKIHRVNFSNRFDRIMKRAGDGMTVLGNQRFFRGMISTESKAGKGSLPYSHEFRQPLKPIPLLPMKSE